MLTEERKCGLQRLSELLRGADFTDVRYYVSHSSTRRSNVRHQKVETTLIADDWNYMVEAGANGKRVRTYFNNLAEPEFVVRSMKEAAPLAWKEYRPVHLTKAVSAECGQKEIVWESEELIAKKLLESEACALAIPGIALVRECAFEQGEQEIYLLDETLKVTCDRTGYRCFKAGVIAKEQGKMETASQCIYGMELADMDAAGCMRQTALEAKKRLGASSVPSGAYKIILSEAVMCELLEAYAPAFYARNIIDEMSALSSKTGTPVAASFVSLVEEPLYEKGRCRRSIDDEGNPVQQKYLIREGVFEQMLYNESTALEAGAQSTGNGFKNSVQSDVATGVTNLVLRGAAGEEKTLEELEHEMGGGLLVTEADGIFAGTDIKTGNFSLIVKGMVVEGGMETVPFREVTIAGNFFEAWKNIKGMGKDYRCTVPENASVSAPAVYVGELAVSGI